LTLKPDFEFSLQVKANQIDGFGIFVKKRSNSKWFNRGSEFEFHNKYGVTTFLLARFVHTIVWETGQYGVFGIGKALHTDKKCLVHNEVKCSSKPVSSYRGSFDENGNSIGTYSVSDMINLTFEDINFISFGNRGEEIILSETFLMLQPFQTKTPPAVRHRLKFQLTQKYHQPR
jgi:hypothetical protein